jgi:uncharacterized protein YfaS (alpha-2-macroglobulin family)
MNTRSKTPRNDIDTEQRDFPNQSETPKDARFFLAILLLTGILLASACLAGGLATSKPTPTPAAVLTSPTAQPIPSGGDLVTILDDGAPLPPQVISIKPGEGQELPSGGQIEITFDQNMDQHAVASAWQMLAPNGSRIQGKLEWPTSRTMLFSPTGLMNGTLYRASLGIQAASAQGVKLTDPLEFQFNTVGELQVSQVFPPDGSIDVENNAVITAIFNRPVVPLVIAEAQKDLPNPLVISPTIAGQGEWISTSVFAFHPEGVLRGATEYTIQVKAGLADAGKDTQLAQDYTWHFNTITPSIGELQLRDGTTNPPDYYRDVLLDESFSVTFFQPMNQESTLASLSLTDQGGGSVPLTTRWNEEATWLTITPTQRLALGTAYTLAIDKEALAADGGSLKDGLNWNFNTVLKPGIDFVMPANGVRQTDFNGEFRIKFFSPMNLETIKDKILINPKPEEVQWWYNDWDWSVNAYFLQPSTQYEIKLLPGMQDIYGNPISTERTIRFTTAPYQPQANLQMPYMPAVIRLGGPQEFYASYRNVKYIDLKLYRLEPSEFVSFQYGKVSQWDYVPPSQDLVWSIQEESTGKLNERVLKSFSPSLPNGDPLPAGFYFLALDSAQIAHSGLHVDTRIVIVANANLTFKSTSSDALLWLTDLESGNPIQGAAITLYDKNFAPIGDGTTGPDGVLYLSDLPAPEDPYDVRYAMTGGSTYSAFASSEWGSGISTYDYGIWSSYYSPANQPTSYVYTDRPIYRPGQPVYFKGIVRLDDDLSFSLPDQGEVTVSINSYEEKIYEQTLPLSPYGSFDGKLMLDENAALGAYTISVRFPDQESLIGQVGFNVAEYRRPEFQLDVNADRQDALAGTEFNVNLGATFYSGGAVAGADVKWTLTSNPYTFNPPGDLSRYTFNDFESDAGSITDNPAYYSQVIAEGQSKTDDAGQLNLTLLADISDYKTSRQLVFEATATDIAGNQVSGRTNVNVHRSAVYIGIRPTTYVGQVGENQSFELVAVDWDGKIIPGQKVDVDIVERRWYSVQQQDAQGRVQWSSTVQEIPVTSFSDLETDSKGIATVTFVPSKGGVYRAKAASRDAQGNETHSSAFTWVSGEEYIPWRQTNDRGFQLVADRDNYEPGDTAELLIASPFQGNTYALVTVERGHVRSHEVIELTSNSTLYKLPITPDMAPNVYVSVVIVKGIDETNPRPNFKIGITQLKVDTRQQAVSVEVIPDKTQVEPGEEVKYTIITRDQQGNPVNAEVSLGLSDLATLSLAGPNSQPILDYFYSNRSLGVWTSVPIVLDIEDYNANIKEHLAEGEGMGSGGGKGGGDLGVIEIRQDFPDTAFWDAHVLTGDKGETQVSVTLPDNLTTWRMDARAVTLDTHVGQTTLDIISTKPLLVSPQTPRFFVVGDEFRIGTAVHNNSDQDLNVEVSITAQGVTLQNEDVQYVDVPAKGQAYAAWDGTVNMDAQRVDLVFKAQGGSFTDASRPTAGTLEGQGIPVYRYDAKETIGTSGQMTSGGSQIEAISLPPSMNISQGELTIELAPSLAAGMTDGLTYLQGYPYECIEQTISRFLPNILTVRALKTAGISDPDLESNLETQVNTALQRLYNWQNPDGGWGWWSNQESDVQTTAYAVLGLIESKDAGYTISDPVLERAVNFLRTKIRTSSSSNQPYQLNRNAFVLYVLAHAGSPEVSQTVKLYDQRQLTSLFARAFLADALYQIDPGDPRVKTLLSDFASNAILSATGTHWEELEPDPWNWNTDTRTTAIILSTVSQIDPTNPLNANAVRWLMSSRQNGHWRGTQETAWTIMALTRWMKASGELQANYNFAVALNGERLGGGAANQDTIRQTLSLKVDIANMLADQVNRLAVARDDGPGNLYYTAHLDVSLPVEDIKALNQGIILSRNYFQEEDSTTPVAQVNWGDMLLARLTIVAPHDLHYVVIDDPLPAGLEAVDQSLKTSPQNEIPQQYAWNDLISHGWGWWYFNHVEMRDEKLVLSADYLPAGTYVYTYLVRAGTAGTFRTIPPTAQEFYFPEVYGRGDGSLFTINP